MKTLVLLFGEDRNDIESLRKLIPALADVGDVDFLPITKPVIFRRNVNPKVKEGALRLIAATVKSAAQKRPVVVVAHRDCDDVEPAHTANADELAADLARAGVIDPIPATPAWEMEAWWLLFPEALAAVRSTWRPVRYTGHVGAIRNSKEFLKERVQPTNRRHGYTESDSITIAQKIAELNLARDPARLRRSASLADFKSRLDAIEWPHNALE